MSEQKYLTDDERAIIKVLNFVATFDGIITSEDEVAYILEAGIEKFIPKSRKHLVRVSKQSYPIKIIKTTNHE